MKRRAELRPLSEHHHHVLVLALEIRRAAESLAPDREQRLRKLARELLNFWAESGQTHFREEEQILLSGYAQHVRVSNDPEVMRMLDDHTAIRSQIMEIKESVGRGFDLDRIVDLGRVLHDHVRLEEDHIFPRVEALLTETELNAVGKRLTRLHGEK